MNEPKWCSSSCPNTVCFLKRKFTLGTEFKSFVLDRSAYSFKQARVFPKAVNVRGHPYKTETKFSVVSGRNSVFGWIFYFDISFSRTYTVYPLIE